MRDTRRFIITNAGEKQYITDADIQYEQYCDGCDEPFDTIQGEDFIYLQIRGGWNKKPVSIPGHSEILLLHERCCPSQIRELLEPIPKERHTDVL